MTSAEAGPFAGLTIINLSTGIAGTATGHLLATQGARVILVEPPGGSPLRRLGPFPDDIPDSEASALFLHLARGQQSLTLDRTAPAGRRLIAAVARGADLIVEDEGAADVHEVRALLKEERGARACSILSLSPFGLTGPWAQRPASDIVVLALSGLLASGGHPTREPLQPPDWIIQIFAGFSAFTAATATLYWQATNGRAHDVDVAMLDVLAAAHENAVCRFSYTEHVHKREGNRLHGAYPWTLLPCKDGYIGMIVLPRNWDVFCLWMERPDLVSDPRFDTPHARTQNADALDEILTEWTMQHTKEELYRGGQERHLPFGAVYTFEEALRDESLQARAATAAIDHPTLGQLLYPTTPYLADGSRAAVAAAPRLSEHTEALLANLDVLTDREELTHLRQEGVL